MPLRATGSDTDARLIDLLKSIYRTNDPIALHAPSVGTQEKEWLAKAIDSGFVSTAGPFVKEFEARVADYTGAKYAVSTMNGTAALHACLYYVGVSPNDLVITQAMTFVATCNAINQLGASPAFVDIDRQTLGMCEKSLAGFLGQYCYQKDNGQCVHRSSGKLIKAIVPMHTFGHPVNISAIVDVANRYGLPVIEDAAESLGSFCHSQHTGTFGHLGVVSFNGNKIVTTGGGGMILCNSEDDYSQLLHLTTTAKLPHAYEFFHDQPGFNYRMPNLNAALGLAQMDKLPDFLISKRRLAETYRQFFAETEYLFVVEPKNAKSNYWLNAIHCPDFESREAFLKHTNANGILTRPVWTLMHRLPAFSDAVRTDLGNCEWAEATLVNIPSSPTSGA